ncbi:alternative oxidase 1 [Polychytrium aggregatum]|uniref:alternative oxidase 1 n=1 Tax=Polychytrium aggregatum TaxID=110093 RepID=UPI0022FE7E6E|nr:alternative oxidase 1 [Polychytrium aggregatum]KAI9205730.1 alternative oxidase 1 [Polychytrium aggregatum]
MLIGLNRPLAASAASICGELAAAPSLAQASRRLFSQGHASARPLALGQVVLPGYALPARAATQGAAVFLYPPTSRSFQTSALWRQGLDHFKEAREARKKESSAETVAAAAGEKDYLLRHPVYTDTQLQSIEVTRRGKHGVRDTLAYNAVYLMRKSFDLMTGYTEKPGGMTEHQWLNRMVFLETVAGVPGMVGGMARHLRSLRSMRRDYGWVHTLLEEAENERMHLLTFLKLKDPGIMFRLTVIVTQGVFFNLFFLTYLISPRTCHRFVGYLEEEATHTYTCALREIDSGSLKRWQTTPAPKIAIQYWRLKEDATVRDVIAAVRADEAEHRDVNHGLGDLDINDRNPF